MNRKEEILHQQISEAWNNSHLGNHPEAQRLICNWTNSESGKSGNKARSMGVKKGIADWQYMADNGRTIWIELKTEDGTQSKEQKQFEALCDLLGHDYYICRDYYSFWEIIGVPIPFQIKQLQTKVAF